MGFMDKLNQVASKVDDVASKSAEKFHEAMEEADKKKDEKKQEKEKYNSPVEGAKQRYRMIYVGGLEDFKPSATDPCAIGFNIMEDRFIIKPEYATKIAWFGDREIIIPFDKINELSQAPIGMGSNASIQSVVIISFTTEDNKNRRLRIQMLDGITYVGQELKTTDMMNYLTDNGILEQINNNSLNETSNDNTKNNANNDNARNNTSSDDVMKQIEKLADLKNKGILSDEEFAEKKKELLARL